MSIKEDAIVLGIAGAGIFVLYESLKSGLFGDVPKKLLSGEYGAQAGTAFFGKTLSGNNSSVATINPKYGTGEKTVADVIYRTPTLNVAATDKAFSNIGLTTQQDIFISQTYGADVSSSIVSKIASGRANALTPNELNILVSIGWHIPENYVWKAI